MSQNHRQSVVIYASHYVSSVTDSLSPLYPAARYFDGNEVLLSMGILGNFPIYSGNSFKFCVPNPYNPEPSHLRILCFQWIGFFSPPFLSWTHIEIVYHFLFYLIHIQLYSYILIYCSKTISARKKILQLACEDIRKYQPKEIM